MITIPCRSQFRIYQPLEEHRQACPKIFVVCTGAHSHPVPLPAKTPSSIRSNIFQLLYDMDYDLPDMTPWRFLRHPTVTQFLVTQLPNITNPSLSDLHISLANCDHLRSYIQNAKASTTWQFVWLSGSVWHIWKCLTCLTVSGIRHTRLSAEQVVR